MQHSEEVLAALSRRQLPRELWFLRKRDHISPPQRAMCYMTPQLNPRKLNMAAPEHSPALGKLQLKYSGDADTPLWQILLREKLRDWKQSSKAFNSCRQTQSIIVLWSRVWWEEHHWELNAINLCKCHGRRLHVVKLFHLKCNIYESHHFFINLQVDTIDHYITEIKSKCYLWVWRTRKCFN